MAVEHIATRKGSSPHVRGAHAWHLYPVAGGGIIPACAGSTLQRPGEVCRGRDHPRMCGEHEFGFDVENDDGGSSPHVRGAPLRPRSR